MAAAGDSRQKHEKTDEKECARSIFFRFRLLSSSYSFAVVVVFFFFFFLFLLLAFLLLSPCDDETALETLAPFPLFSRIDLTSHKGCLEAVARSLLHHMNMSGGGWK